MLVCNEIEVVKMGENRGAGAGNVIEVRRNSGDYDGKLRVKGLVGMGF